MSEVIYAPNNQPEENIDLTPPEGLQRLAGAKAGLSDAAVKAMVKYYTPDPVSHELERRFPCGTSAYYLDADVYGSSS